MSHRSDFELLHAYDMALEGQALAMTHEELGRLAALLSRRQQAAFWREQHGPPAREGAD